MNLVLGIDIGGTGIKGGIVDIDTATLTTDRKRILTPHPGTPNAILDVVKQLVDHFDWKGKPIGIGFPSLIKNGVCLTANNMDNSWIGLNMEAFFSKALASEVRVINDANAAGLAEWSAYNKNNTQKDFLLLTLGTGVGSCLIVNNHFIPNTELGSLLFKNGTVEDYISNQARKDKNLSWKEWGLLLNSFLLNMERVFSPDIIVLGGGVCKKYDKYKKYITTKIEVKPAELQNAAGAIGAALTFKTT